MMDIRKRFSSVPRQTDEEDTSYFGQSQPKGLFDRLKRNVTQPSGDNAYKAGMLLFGGKPQDDGASKLANQIALLKIRESLRGSNNGDVGPVPTGFVQAGNKVVKDPTYKSPQEQITDVPEGYQVVGGKVVRDRTYVEPKAPPMLNEKEQFDLDQAKKKNENQSEMVKNSASSLLDAVDEINKTPDYFGPLGGLPTIPFSPDYDARKNWESNIDLLKSKLVLNLLNEMKQASRTGASGFGALNIEELKKLEEGSTALRRNLGSGDASRYLSGIQESAYKVLGDLPSFKDEAEAEASGYKGRAIIGGRRAKIS